MSSGNGSPVLSDRDRDLAEGVDLGPDAYDEQGRWVRPANRPGQRESGGLSRTWHDPAGDFLTARPSRRSSSRKFAE